MEKNSPTLSLTARAESDQQAAKFIAIAESLVAYRETLSAGFNEQESFRLVLDLQQLILMKEFYPETPLEISGG